jgi:hypothetical protein
MGSHGEWWSSHNVVACLPGCLPQENPCLPLSAAVGHMSATPSHTLWPGIFKARLTLSANVRSARGCPSGRMRTGTYVRTHTPLPRQTGRQD